MLSYSGGLATEKMKEVKPGDNLVMVVFSRKSFSLRQEVTGLIPTGLAYDNRLRAPTDGARIGGYHGVGTSL